MKKIMKPLLILIGMIVMLFVLAVIVNLSVFDEDLLPEVQAIKDIKAKPYQSDNAYPALLALSYYPDESYQSATSKIRDLLNKNISEKGQDFLNAADNKSLKSHEINASHLAKYIHCQTRTEKNCVQKYINKLENQAIDDSKTLTLLKRYEKLIEYDQFSEATQLKFNSPMPAFAPVSRAQRVLLLKTWFNNKQEIIPLLLKDLNFWRMMLEDSHHLITNMISVAAVNNDIHFMAYVIQSGEFNNSQLVEVQNQIKSLNEKEKKLLKTFRSEAKGAMNFFDYYNNESEDFLGKLFYQPQATLNLQYITNIEPLISIDKLDSRSFNQAFQSKDWPVKPKLKSAISLYNPTGKLFMNITIYAYQDYLARMHDLDAMLTLLNLRIELALNNDQDIASVTKNSNHKNPYTGKPFDFDASNQTIGFNCLDRTSVCEIAL